ncbi:hypothetical protein PQX77_021022 [Marasmius sp. AFHP31]|nr:hypothetical protein PQX77_021022 [Marasmius sp. AFHP31]
METSFFAGARNLTIRGGSFNSVHGNQINNITHVYTKQRRERTEYDEFYPVKRGAIYRIKEIGHHVYPPELDGADTVICTAEVNGERGRIFTVVSYEAPEAHETFEEDFKRYSRAVRLNLFRLYGLNRSEVPSLIFYGEYIPATILQGRVGPWGQYYQKSLASQLGCYINELWLDPSTGRLCRGPMGPDAGLKNSYLPFKICAVPSDLNISQEHDFLHFLTTLRHGQQVALEIPTVISNSTGSTISFGSMGWTSENKLLGMRAMLANGMVRFTLTEDNNPFLRLGLDWQQEMAVWLSQASSVFHASAIPLEGDTRDYQLIVPHLTLEGHLSPCSDRIRRPIHLFIPPSLFTPSESRYETIDTHFWSHDSTGEAPLSKDEYLLLGLPTTILLTVSPSKAYSWDIATYKAMADLQLAKGFDPNTTDFAEYIEYPLYRVVQGDSSRFEEVEDREASTSTNSTSVWSYLSSGWSWNASEDLDIPAAVV